MTSRWTTFTCIALTAGTAGFLAGLLGSRRSAPLADLPLRQDAPSVASQPLVNPIPGMELPGPGESGNADDLMFFPETVLADAEALAPEDSSSRVTGEPGFLPQPSSTATPLLSLPTQPSALEQLIDAEFSGLSDEQREVWLEVLSGLPLEDAAGILRIWKQFGHGAGLSTMLVPDSLSPGAIPPEVSSHPQSDQHAPQIEAPAFRRIRDMIVLNLLNAETHGFRRYEPLLSDRASAVETASGPALTSLDASDPASAGVGIEGWRIDQRPGAIVQTGNSLDVAISGPGFFVVASDAETFYTRCGRFRTDDQGRLVLDQNRSSAGLQPPIVVPSDADEVLIEADGTVHAIRDGQEPEEIGRVELATFRDPGHLQPVGHTLFSATDRSGPPVHRAPHAAGTGRLQQRALESSNVDFQDELSRLEWFDRMLRGLDSGDSPSP